MRLDRHNPMPNETISERLGTTDGATICYTAQLGYVPFLESSLLIKCGDEVFETAGEGKLKSNKDSTGYYDTSRGTITVVFKEAPVAGHGLIATYRYMPRNCGVYEMYTDAQGRITLIPV